MNAILFKKAMEKVINPNCLVNTVSQRVRQLNTDGGHSGGPLLTDTASLGAADIALREITEEEIGFEMHEITGLTRPTEKNRRQPQHWARS